MAAPNVVPVTGKKKSQVSAPMIYALLIVLGAAIYLNLPNQNTAPTSSKHRTATTTRTAGADINGIIAADYTAHFPRYAGNGRNPYVPGILSASQQNSSASGNLLGGKSGLASAGGTWSLTGVNVINGVTSALIESSSGDSVTLKKGDNWHGLRVTSVSSDTIIFQNELGQTTQLNFNAPAANGTGNGGANPDAPAVPSLSQIRPLPPLTVTSSTPTQPAGGAALGFPPPPPGVLISGATLD